LDISFHCIYALFVIFFGIFTLGELNMKMKKLVLSVLIVVSGTVLTGLASAASLAGSEGDVRSRPDFGDSGPCHKIWKQYVAASGHSSYATTPYSRMSEAIICGGSINAGSKAAAETKALAQCNAGLKRWKVNAVRNCKVAASK
jgi:hypothetical protein